MIEEKKIEEAKKSFIADKKILGIMAMNDLACGFKEGAKWAINEVLKNLWHDVDEIPKRAKAFIFECGDYSMNYHVGMMFNPNDYKKNAEIWHMNRWCYLEDILPKQEGGEQ